ncbi:MAG TPA: S-layer homology domain-containing protein [Candidatus Evtepia faecigallinarum]|nr:S-layer homology domain-containing protein [Candidatus Evtepia faecigallinarum]
MTKRLIRLLFCAGLLLGLLTVTALAAAPEGTGTAEDPYQISSAEELYWFAGLVNGDANIIGTDTQQDTSACAVLTADIDLADIQWTSIGKDESNAYIGTFDGQGHTISGLNVNNSTSDYTGLFGYVGGDFRDGMVKNVSVSGAVTGNGNYIGGVCGYIDVYGRIENCSFSGTVNGGDNLGGVCGYNCGTIANCYSTGSVTGSGSYVGGVCGYNGRYSYDDGEEEIDYIDGKITNCYWLANDSSGGSVGFDEGTVEEVASKTAEKFASGEVTWLLNQGQINGPWRQTLGNGGDATPILDETHGFVVIISSTQKYENVELKYENGFGPEGGGLFYQAAQKDDGVYQIGNAGQLYWFAGLVNGKLGDGTPQNTAAHAVLTADITINKNVLTADGKLNGSPAHAWTPIGKDGSVAYTGIFDGQNHIIFGLYCDINETVADSDVYVGLFGRVKSGTVKNVTLKDCYLSGKTSTTGTVNIGGVCGANIDGDSYIENCRVEGTVTGSGNVGGVCGWNYGSSTAGDTTRITNCSSAGTVSGSGNVGGVCGLNDGDTIINCYNTGTVSGTGNVGGVCGESNSAIVNCYNTGAVSGNGNDNVGGVCGQDTSNYGDGSLITNCYWLQDTASSGIGNGNGEATAKKTADQFASGEVAWLLNGEKVNDTWRQNLEGSEKDPSPTLDSTHGIVHYTGEGYEQFIEHHYDTEGFCGCGVCQPATLQNGVYQIGNAGQLYWFAGLVNGDSSIIGNEVPQNAVADAELTADISINQNVLTEDFKLNGDGSQFRLWASPIGTEIVPYNGTFDGKSYAIRGLYYKGNSFYAGLFGQIGTGGVVKNLKLEDSYAGVDARVNFFAYGVGGVCAVNLGTIENCSFSGFVEDEQSASTNIYVGGVCGRNDGSITSCYSTGNVFGAGDGNVCAGGVCGRNFGSGSITNCYNTNAVTGWDCTLGGVCGENAGSIANCYNTGNVTNGDCYTGGVCGENLSSITNCYSTGNVEAGTPGGVCGSNDGGSITSCYSTGNVTGGTPGGVCGYNYAANGGTAIITNCYSTGNVSGDSDFISIFGDRVVDVGGVCGYNYAANGGTAIITNCYSTGNVSGDGNDNFKVNVGGVCGGNEVYSNGNASISNCYWLEGINSSINGIGNDSNATGAEKKTAEQFASGEVAWLLNSEQENGPWRQTLGTDNFPVLASTHSAVYRVTVEDEVKGYYNSGDTFTLPDATEIKPGYTFLWSGGGKTYEPGATATITADTTFTAQWTANIYTVTLHPNDGTIAEGKDVTSYTYGVGAALPTEVTRRGYTFAGWYESADFSGSPVTAITDTDIGNKIYYAKWTVNTYAVTLNPNSGAIAEGENVTSYTYGVGAVLPTDVTRRGYTFAGWYDNEELGGDPVTAIPADAIGDVAYWAKWEPVSSGGRPTLTVSQQLINKIKAAKDGDTVEITLKPSQTKLDKEVFETLSGRDVTLVLHLDGEVDWTIYGLDIAADAVLTDLDMGVSMNTTTIPVDLINAITGEIGTVQITLAHDGEFGFVLTLTAPLGAENEGLWANLYRYDESAGAMTFQTAALVDEDGNVALPFDHASQYALVLDDKSHELPFTDLTAGAWYWDAVAYVYRHDMMAGYGDNLFGPNDDLSRAQLCQIVYNMEGQPTASGGGTFNDVADGAWYFDAVTWAASQGIVGGYGNGKFGPDDAITREQLATILYRYAQAKGYDVSVGEDTNILSYTDAQAVSEYSIPAMQWACGAGIIEGVTESTLAPQGNSTRAQVATMLMRFCEEYGMR